MSSSALAAALEAVGAPLGALVTVLAVPVYDPAIELAEEWGADGADLIAAALEPTADLLELRDALAAGDRASVKRTLAGDLERSLEPVLREHALRAAAAGYVTTLRAWGAPEAHAAVPLPPKLVQWIGRAIAAELKGLVAGGKQAVRQAVQAAVAKGGQITPAMVRSVRQAIALTPRQQAALDRFRRAQAKAGLKGRKLDAAVRAEAKRVLDDRARLIAEEQTARAMAMAQRVAWGALAKAGRINARWRKLWVTKRDQLVCPVCEDLDGETAPLDGLFDDEFYGPPEPHPKCRCQIILVAPGERHSAYFVDYVFPGNPWHVERRGRGRFLVVQSLSGKVVGEHGTLAQATAQIRALHASVPEGHEFDPDQPRDDAGRWSSGAGGELTAEEKAALKDFQAIGFVDVNNSLRQGLDPPPVVATLDSAFRKAAPLEKDETVLKGIGPTYASRLAELGVGAGFKDLGFPSTTSDPKIAKKFGVGQYAGSGGTVRIRLSQGSRVLRMVDAGLSGYESETLLPRGVTFRITGVSKKGAAFNIDVDAIMPEDR